MSYKTIAVCLTSEAEARRLVPIAALLARKFDAHVNGLYCLQNIEVYAGISMQLSVAAIAEMQSVQQEHANKVMAAFDELTKDEAISARWQPIEPHASASGEPMAEKARAADLLMISQADPEHSHSAQAALQRHVIEQSGRPVLVVPLFANVDNVGSRILVGWSGTRECARALHDAMPFLEMSKETRLFWISDKDGSSESSLAASADDMKTALERHSVPVQVSHRTKTEIPVGDELLNEAADSSIDLIVTGAFGHSRLYDFVIGATTTHLLKYMTTPVLFAH